MGTVNDQERICTLCAQPAHGSTACEFLGKISDAELQALDEHLQRLLYGDGVSKPLGIFTTPAEPLPPRISLAELGEFARQMERDREDLLAAVVMRSELESALLRMHMPDPTPAVPVGVQLCGFRLEFDEALPPGVYEFRNAKGRVLRRFSTET